MFRVNSSCRQRSWIDLALDLALSGKLTSSKQMNKREAKKRWKIFSTKIAGNYFPVEKVFHRADEFSLSRLDDSFTLFVDFLHCCTTIRFNA